MAISFFGVRHHGPGTARSLERALRRLEPDLLLVEGPPEAEPILKSLIDPMMKPPVAILAYDPKSTKYASFYPFAEFSPEWRAFKYALENEAEIRLMDLPITHKFGLLANKEAEQEKAKSKESSKEKQTLAQDQFDNDELFWREAILRDPLSYFGQLAGFGDGETWWESQVELSQRDDEGLFEAVAEMMVALRESLGGWGWSPHLSETALHEFRREASMRKSIAKAQKEGFQKIAVICGAWHIPALINPPPLKEDRQALKTLPKSKVSVTWVPWTYGRLCTESGYGAGVISPGWYDHLWERGAAQGAMWLSKVAHALRDEGLDISPAHIIETLRLAETLAALRSLPLPRLDEFNESIRAVMLFGDDLSLDLIKVKLMIGERIGSIPPTLPATPLEADLKAEQKRVRLKATPEAQEKVLDLRKPLDLEKSRLLHRLLLLDIPWGTVATSQGEGTFKETWTLCWKPEFALSVIDKARWGQTIETASISYAQAKAHNLSLGELSELILVSVTAALPSLSSSLLKILRDKAALCADLASLILTIKPLAELARYSDVRAQSDSTVNEVIRSIVPRVTASLVNACIILDDEAAQEMRKRIEGATLALKRLQDHELLWPWYQALIDLIQRDTAQAILRGSACRLLNDAEILTRDQSYQEMRVALSAAAEPSQSAAWLEGFLGSSGLLLIYDDGLWSLVDEWVCSLSSELFLSLLPLIRRTVSKFSQAERRQLAERIDHVGSRHTASLSIPQEFPLASSLNIERVLLTIPLLERIFSMSKGSRFKTNKRFDQVPSDQEKG